MIKSALAEKQSGIQIKQNVTYINATGALLPSILDTSCLNNFYSLVLLWLVREYKMSNERLNQSKRCAVSQAVSDFVPYFSVSDYGIDWSSLSSICWQVCMEQTLSEMQYSTNHAQIMYMWMRRWVYMEGRRQRGVMNANNRSENG